MTGHEWQGTCILFTASRQKAEGAGQQRQALPLGFSFGIRVSGAHCRLYHLLGTGLVICNEGLGHGATGQVSTPSSANTRTLDHSFWGYWDTLPG